MEKNNSSENNIQPDIKNSAEQNDANKKSKNKGTGMSSEGDSDLTEESWQGTAGGTMSNAQLESKNQGNEKS